MNELEEIIERCEMGVMGDKDIARAALAATEDT